MTPPKPGRAQQVQVMFVGHDASRSGAPFVLLHLVRWLKEHSDLSFGVFLLDGGPLAPEFQALAPTWILDTPGLLKKFPKTGLGSIPARAYGKLRRLGHRRHFADGGPSLIYLNTTATAWALKIFPSPATAVVAHIHELETMIRILGQEGLEQIKRRATRYIAASEAVRSSLVEHNGVEPGTVEVIHEFIPLPEEPEGGGPGSRSKLLGRLGLPADALLVGGAGTTEWRKGTDLFVQMAALIRRSRPDLPVHFLWVGGSLESSFTDLAISDARRAGVADRVHFLGSSARPHEIMAHFDVFAMTSREDPYPLVMLEAGALGTPIVCFAHAGGTPEFVEEDAGFIVPYLDVAAMAEAVARLLTDHDLRARMGSAAASKLRDRHTVDRTAPKILALIRSLIPAGS